MLNAGRTEQREEALGAEARQETNADLVPKLRTHGVIVAAV
jgi:hypothetical protein